jgi:hypothetical protein
VGEGRKLCTIQGKENDKHTFCLTECTNKIRMKIKITGPAVLEAIF